MAIQKKLWATELNRDWWKDIDRSISWLVRDLITYSDPPDLATKLKKDGVGKVSDNLIYCWANPGREQLPSLKQFLLLVKHTENCEPLKTIVEACGYVVVPGHDLQIALKELVRAYDKKQNEI